MSDDQQYQVLGELVQEFDMLPPAAMDTRARQIYNDLREVNPWLPDPNCVSGHDEITLSFGPQSASTLTLTVMINLPEGLGA